MNALALFLLSLAVLGIADAVIHRYTRRSLIARAQDGIDRMTRYRWARKKA